MPSAVFQKIMPRETYEGRRRYSRETEETEHTFSNGLKDVKAPVPSCIRKLDRTGGMRTKGRERVLVP